MKIESGKIKVVVCDDHQVVLEGLRLIIQQTPFIELVGMFHLPETLIAFLNQSHQKVDVVIIDAHLGNGKNGLDIPALVPNFNSYRWILFSSYVDKYLAFQAERAGFNACLSKEVPSSVLISTISTMEELGFVCYPQLDSDDSGIKNMELIHNAISSLTKRERQVMDILLKGYSSKECADHLHISIFTFETHKKNIFRKLEINSTSELMRIAIDFKFV